MNTWIKLNLIVLSLSISIRCQTPVKEGHIPEKKIEFPHVIHANIEGLDCTSCHQSSADTVRTESDNMCLNCHDNSSVQSTSEKPH